MTARLRRVRLYHDTTPTVRQFPRWKKALQYLLMFLAVGGWLPVAMACDRFIR